MVSPAIFSPALMFHHDDCCHTDSDHSSKTLPDNRRRLTPEEEGNLRTMRLPPGTPLSSNKPPVKSLWQRLKDWLIKPGPGAASI